MSRRFPLQRLLKVRRLIESLREKELSECKQRMRRQRQILLQLRDDKATLTHELASLVQPSVDRLMRYDEYRAGLHDRIRTQEWLLTRVGAEYQNKRQLLIQANKEKQMLEKLRERHQMAIGLFESREEQKHLDEIASRQKTMLQTSASEDT